MKLNPVELKELNSLLSDKRIDVPDFRRTVSSNGHNYVWLSNNITIRNPGISARLKDLLSIK